MPQENNPRTGKEPRPTGAGMVQRIEKGWTVYDAEERPVGNVTDVDTARSMLIIDGRPAGFDAFELPFQLIQTSGDGEVRLSQSMDVRDTSTESVPRFVTASTTRSAPTSTSTVGTVTSTSGVTSRVRTERPRDAASASPEPSPVRASTTTTTPGAVAQAAREGNVTPTPTSSTTVTPSARTPYTATSTPQAAADRWIQHDWERQPADETWSAKRLVGGALAVGGLAAATYIMRRRRRKTTTERIADAVMEAFGTASDFARDRNPAWWVSLAAALLPAAYYAWPSSLTKTVQRAGSRGNRMDAWPDTLGSYTTAVSTRVPSSDDLATMMRDAWRRAMSSEGSMSVRPDLALTGGLLAASALAFYLARRSTGPSTGVRIADVMTRQPRVVQPDATVADAALMMRRLDIGALPVCDGSRLIGMLTDRDITLRSTADGRDPHLTPVRDIMTPGVAWASEDDPVEAAARIMRDHRIRRLPIVNERHSLVGVVSLGDLAVDFGDDQLSGDTLETISQPSRPDR